MIILFDGVCNFCNASINFLIDRDPKGVFRFAALQSEPGREILAKHNIKVITDFDSVILEKDGKLYQKSDAALEIARNMNGLWKLLYGFKIVPKFIRDFVYDIVAKNRYRFMGKMDACRLPTPELRARFL
ncbi:thiol-disulfide oxidoreductase DCC family protein [Emticicia sp. BO119]|uniref:thiol-disulfide oxidoreductase DCC family protein n=1 Tax=Emticicia sp. BO119 TaxID=2757768 RepID=UPI0015F0CE41|nr:thiol-disulfide oxidoreductase DCC family protein [Emticicia sp. BO119]MBA4851113.1 thiol-disulfide oxidoreductase DCC family protein [Emticicia sp. BO119]